MIFMKKSKIEKALLEAYVLAYRNATPSANFIELMDNAKLDKDGRKIIDYDAYFCKHEVLKEIVEGIIIKYKLNEREIKILNFNFWLGCSPRSNKKNDLDNN